MVVGERQGHSGSREEVMFPEKSRVEFTGREDGGGCNNSGIMVLKRRYVFPSEKRYPM